MRDKQVFETTKLTNGITVHYYPTDQPFAMFNLMIPIGSANNVGQFVPGTSHFFEHIATLRSKRNMQRNSFSEWVGLNGGYFNAFTDNFNTVYTAQVPSSISTIAWEGFYSQIFETLIKEEDFEKERGVVSNERKQRKWYPGSSELSNYLWTSWVQAETVSRRQLFGEDIDLALLTGKTLSKFHKYYFTPDIHVVVGGSVQIKRILETLSELSTNSSTLAESYTPYSWKRKNYHERGFSDVEAPVYFAGSCHKLPSYEERVAIRFLFEFLTDFHHGPLYKWLRNDNGWAYRVSYDIFTSGKEEVVFLEIPLHNLSQVAETRKELDGRIVRAISDSSMLATEVERQLGAEVFDYQTLENILDEALGDIKCYGRVTSEAEYRGYKRRCADPVYMNTIYEKYFGYSVRGEFCAIPK